MSYTAGATLTPAGERAIGFSWRALLGLLLVVILFIPIRRFSLPGRLPFQLEPYRLTVAALMVIWLAAMLVDLRIRVRKSLFDGPIFIIVVALLSSVAANSSRIETLGVSDVVAKKLTFFASYLIVYYLIVSVVRDRDMAESLLKVLVGGGAVVAVFAIIESYTHYNAFNDLPKVLPILRVDELPQAITRSGRWRVYGPAQSPIALGALFAMLLPLAVFLVRRTASARWKLITLVIALGLFSCSSRTPILMLLPVAIVFLWLRPAAVKRFLPALLPFLVLVHVALPGAIGAIEGAFFPKGGLIAQQQNQNVGSGRIADLGPALAQFAQQPLLGQGFGTRIVDPGPRMNAFVLDDQWLGTLLETGVFGTAGFLWFFVRFIRKAGAEAKRDRSPRGALFAALAASIAAYSIGLFTFDAFSFIQITFMPFIVMGLGAALLRPPESRVLVEVITPPRAPVVRPRLRAVTVAALAAAEATWEAVAAAPRVTARAAMRTAQLLLQLAVACVILTVRIVVAAVSTASAALAYALLAGARVLVFAVELLADAIAVTIYAVAWMLLAAPSVVLLAADLVVAGVILAAQVLADTVLTAGAALAEARASTARRLVASARKLSRPTRRG